MGPLDWRKPWYETSCLSSHPACLNKTSPGASGSCPQFAPIKPPEHKSFDLQQAIEAALREDRADDNDITTDSTVDAKQEAIGTFLAKADGVLAGLAVADAVFRHVDPKLKVTWDSKDGEHVSKGTKFGTVQGNAASLLIAERIALNFMQRMAGIATATALMCKEVEGTEAKIIDTRKTVPGLRVLDKWAVTIGGGANHRMGLYDMVLIKDNHITAAGGLTAAVIKCQEYLDQRAMTHVPFEVETRTLDEVGELMDLIASGGASYITRIMLDNMARANPKQPGDLDVTMLRTAVSMVGGRIETEASGNVTLATVKRIAETGVKFISSGALTHSVTAMDISLKISLV